MANLSDIVTIPYGHPQNVNDVYFNVGGDTAGINAIRIVPPETRVWNLIGFSWKYDGCNWINPGDPHAKGSGGTFKFTIHNMLANGLPDLTSTLATEQLSADTTGAGAGGNVYKLQQRSKALVGWSSDAQYQYNHMEIPAGLSVIAGRPIWLLIRNMHASPGSNTSNMNPYTLRNTVYNPDGTTVVPANAVNTTDPNANYAIFGLDPREVLASKPDAGTAWGFGRNTGRYQGPAGSNDDLRVEHYFWREQGSTRLRSKAFAALAYNTTAGTAAPYVEWTNAPSAAVLKYFMMYPTASGTCSVTAVVKNAAGATIQTVVGTATASAPASGAPMIGVFPSNVNVAIGQAVRLTGNKDVWVTELDGYTGGFRSATDDWRFTTNAGSGNYPGIAAFGVRGQSDWPWGYANRQRIAEGGGGTTPIESNLVVSASSVSFTAQTGGSNPSAQSVRITDTANGPQKAFSATVSGTNSSWLQLRVGTTGTVGTTVTGTADADLYLIPTNQPTAGSYQATVTITNTGLVGDTVAPVTASLSVVTPQPVGTYDQEILSVATRYWKLEEASGNFLDSLGGGSLVPVGTGITYAVDVNTGTTAPPAAGFTDALDDLGSTIIAHWPLGEAFGSAIDRKNARNGALSGSVVRGITTLLTDGTDDDASQFGGTDTAPSTDLFEVTAAAAFNSATWSVLAWAKVTGGQGTYRAVVSNRDASVASEGWVLYASDTNVWELWIGTTGGWEVATGPAVQVGQTVFLAGTWDGSVMNLYVNAGAPAVNVPADPYDTQSTLRPVRIGAGRNETTPFYYFRGVIDEPAVANTALTAAQVQTLYLAGTGQ
jgi:hypothetical protein